MSIQCHWPTVCPQSWQNLLWTQVVWRLGLPWRDDREDADGSVWTVPSIGSLLVNWVHVGVSGHMWLLGHSVRVGIQMTGSFGLCAANRRQGPDGPWIDAAMILGALGHSAPVTCLGTSCMFPSFLP